LKILARPIPILATVLVLALPLAATAENDFGRGGVYVRGGVAAAFDLTSLLGEFVDTGVGLGLAGGYRVNEWLAVEGQYHWLGHTSIETTSVEITRWDTTANVRASLSGRFQPYALIGVGYGNYEQSLGSASASAGGFVAQFGGGLDVYITRHVAVYAEGSYMMATGDIDLFDYAVLGAGAMWRF